MTVPRTTLILVPAYNEQGRIGHVLNEVGAAGVVADVVVIDDGSSDETAAEARARGAHVIRHPFNLGYGAALLTGYRYASQHGYRRVVQMDADGQHDPQSLNDLLAALDAGADVAIGSRYLGGRAPRTSFARRVGSRFFSWVVTRWTKTRITDPTSGYQAMKTSALLELAHDGFPDDYPDADVLILLTRAGLNLVEVPVVMHPRAGGSSMHRWERAVYYGYKMMLTLCLLPVRRRGPYRSDRDAPAQAS